MMYGCPYRDCSFRGTDDKVDDHRATGVHNDQPQAGSNVRIRVAEIDLPLGPGYRVSGHNVTLCDAYGK